MKVKISFVFLLILLSMLTFTFSQDSIADQLSGSQSMDTDKSGIVTSVIRESASNDDFQQQQLINLNHIAMIELGAGYYHDATGSMPDDLKTLFYVFMPIWPGCIYTGKPYKVADHIPDPASESDIGYIYYERISDHQAKLHYLDIDLKVSQDNNLVWKTVSYDVHSNSASFIVNPTEFPTGEFIVRMSSQDRLVYGFNQNIGQILLFLLGNNLKRTGRLDASISEMMRDGIYYFSENGLAELKMRIGQQSLKFDMGSVGDEHHYYYSACKPDDNEMDCIKVSDTNPYEIEYDVKCPELTEDSQSIFSSDTLSTTVLDQDLMLNVNDI
jgi:hypothetical protein